MGRATPNKSSFCEEADQVENVSKNIFACMKKTYFSFYNSIFSFSRSSVEDNPVIN